MRKRCSELAWLALLASAGGHGTEGCPAATCSADAFISGLLRVADLPDPAALQQRYADVFGVALARHTRVLVSPPLEVQSPNDVARFLRLGDEFYPLSLGAPQPCVGLTRLAQGLEADGWSGGREPAAGGTWIYRKGRTQLTARGAAAAPQCAGEIVVTFRRPHKQEQRP